MINKSTSRGSNRGSGRSSGGGRHRGGEPRAPKEFDERVLEINRVTRVVKGGKRMRFRALVVIGDNISRVSFGLGKAADVTTAVQKAVVEAKKRMQTIKLIKGALPYRITGRYKSAQVLIKPAPEGTGLVAGGSVRIVLQLAGVKNAAAKVLGSSNKISNVVATIQALSHIRLREDIMAQRGFTKTKSADSKSTDNSKL
ncbi:MAG: 30S ribosomal protein S5 [bacterium]